MPCLKTINSKFWCRNCPFVGKDAVAKLEFFNVFIHSFILRARQLMPGCTSALGLLCNP
jgi:hypothetical protein